MIFQTERNMKRKLMLLLILINCSMLKAQIDLKYRVFAKKSDNLQNAYFLDRLQKLFDLRRDDFLASLNSKEAMKKRQNKLRQWYKNIVGELPRKTPLNIIVTKECELENFDIQWIAFESRPNHHVTGMLYLPKKGNAPYPAVYIPSGHSVLGKGGETYQKAARLFALNGFVVLVADPICQGERFQYLDENGKQVTEERMLMHEILGEKLMLTGSNTLIHELWDNIRCIDFLEQHPLVDNKKMAVAGNSGGGTQTTYLVALDQRIKVATPSCYIATTEKKINTIGSQDGCQQLWGEGKVGMEEQDFLLLASPKPIRILSASEDFFEIDGARKAYAELKKAYTLLGVPEKIDHIIVEGKHGWHKPLREASVQWCKKWLLNDDSPVIEPEDIGFFEVKEELLVTTTGQVLTYFEDEKSVSDLIRIRLLECETNRKSFKRKNSTIELIQKAKSLIGFNAPAKNSELIKVESYSHEIPELVKYLLKREEDSDFYLPALLFKPYRKSKNVNVTIIVSEFGKENEIGKSGRIINELDKGNYVLAVDVSNTGELKNDHLPKYDNKEFWIAKLPLYEGKTLLAYRVEDILLFKNNLEKIVDKKIDEFNLISVGLTGPAALHAAFFDGQFKSVELINSLQSWVDVSESEYTPNLLGNIVPDVLNYYDMPDLIELITDTNVIYTQLNSQ